MARVTMKEIASRSGVAVSTVSRVLSGADPGSASSHTAARIRAIADELGYSPDPIASSLRTQRTHAVGVLVPRLTDVVLATSYEGIDAAATAAGYQALVSSTWDDLAEQRRRVEWYLTRRVDGLLLGDAHLRTPFLRELEGRGVPFVLFSRRSGPHTAVTGDDRVGGALAAEHLIRAGHRRMGVIAGPRHASTGRDRVRGFQDACRAAELAPDATSVRESTFDADGGFRVARELLRERPRPTALFAVNDFAAIGAMGAVREAGLAIGDDVAIVGYNDISIAGRLTVPLTTVRTQLSRMGEIAFATLLARLRGEAVDSQRLSPQLVIRESTARADSIMTGKVGRSA